jgi:hypothetical protein
LEDIKLSWSDIWKIVVTAIISLGGVGTILWGLIKFSADKIAERLSAKYELQMNKELEAFKNQLDKKNYISKTRFDAEFAIYRELSKTFFDAAKAINTMIPQGFAYVSADKEERRKHENESYRVANNAIVLAQDALHQNAPFIPDKLYKEFDEILPLCRLQITEFGKRYSMSWGGTQEEKECLNLEAYKRTGEIFDKLKQLNDDMRNYLSTLDVIT